MIIQGKHIIIDAFECDALHLNNITYLEALCNKAAMDAGMEVLNSYFYPFQPQGLTGFLLLSTSHLSIHTWPEERYASLDFYTCGDQDLTAQVDFLIRGLSTKKAMVYSMERGVSQPQLVKFNEMTAFDHLKEKTSQELDS
ncbi:adenosylmethionine decarboxylase [Bacillus sp. V5-8f]|uniref:adenosylmethionine decarboxylase n=1 Tax=Bacillus sp. V5-8f TaxID=2053044 RepID=UPI000C75F802|nr:adenosylmethionine decarboxylase [Bacillus sp. V5-8f]PLT33168.1 adenosylmethionine decarboxylase [Bacillus sp. V5-8f]